MTKIIQNVLNEATQKLVIEFNPEQILLFGSHAWGQPNENSDLNLLVIVSESNQKAVQRSIRAHRCRSGLTVPKDVLVRTRTEVEHSRIAQASLIRQIMDRGKVIYGRG